MKTKSFSIPLDENEQKLEWSIFLSNVIKQHTTQLQKIHNAYHTIIEIVQKFPEYLPKVNPELNKNYEALCGLVEENLNQVVKTIDREYYADRADNLPSFWIDPNILSNNFYKPFANLYTAEAEISEHKLNWPDVYKKMNNFLGTVSKLIREVGIEEDELPELDEVKIAKQNLVNISQGIPPEEVRYPKGWTLVETSAKPTLMYQGKDVFVFFNNWANKFRYFKCLWINYGHPVDYKTIFEFEYKGKYSNKDKWKTNSNVRNTLTKLNKELVKTPLEIKINKGAVVKIKSSRTASNSL